VLIVIAALAGDAAADATRAAEHFAAAQEAERRNDWRAAIASYELAYQVSPHPNVLYNIGVNYQRLGEGRQAAAYLRRYLEAAPRASDRAQVLEQIDRLRRRPSQVTFSSRPPGATIVLDGRELGAAPVSVELAAGQHTAHAVLDGTSTPPRQVVVEYGEPIAIELHVGAQPGRLTIESSAAGATIQIDGKEVGPPPHTTVLAAGSHAVVVTAAGYRGHHQVVEVRAGGDEKLRIDLERQGGGASAPLVRSGAILIGFGAGISSGTDDGGAGRFLLQAGYRAPSTRWDLVASYGSFGTLGSTGIGGEVRYYIAGKRLRPYVRGGLAIGFGDGDTGAGGLGGEGGIGVHYHNYPKGRSLFWEYFVEANMQLARVDDIDPIDSPDDGTTAAIGPVLSAVHLQFPITVGVTLRFGGTRR
jgi:hypothetical protein